MNSAGIASLLLAIWLLHGALVPLKVAATQQVDCEIYPDDENCKIHWIAVVPKGRKVVQRNTKAAFDAYEDNAKADEQNLFDDDFKEFEIDEEAY